MIPNVSPFLIDTSQSIDPVPSVIRLYKYVTIIDTRKEIKEITEKLTIKVVTFILLFFFIYNKGAYKNSITTPSTATTAPAISLAVTFSL